MKVEVQPGFYSENAKRSWHYPQAPPIPAWTRTLPSLLQAVGCIVGQSPLQVQSPHLSLSQSSKGTVSEESFLNFHHSITPTPVAHSQLKDSVMSSLRLSWPLHYHLLGQLSSGHKQLRLWALHIAVRPHRTEHHMPRSRPSRWPPAPPALGLDRTGHTLSSVREAVSLGRLMFGPLSSVFCRSGNLLSN